MVLNEALAAAIGAGLPVSDPVGNMVVDIGGGTTDVAIIALGGVVASTSIRHAGDKFNEAIVQYIRKRHALLIGDKTAEELKINLGCACMDEDEFGNEIFEKPDMVESFGVATITGIAYKVRKELIIHSDLVKK